jgi:hypothetical protein
MPDDDPPKPAPPPPDKPPLLDYPSRPQTPELDSEPWPQVIRAGLIVFGILGFLAFIFYGLCGGLVGGCG